LKRVGSWAALAAGEKDWRNHCTSSPDATGCVLKSPRCHGAASARQVWPGTVMNFPDGQSHPQAEIFAVPCDVFSHLALGGVIWCVAPMPPSQILSNLIESHASRAPTHWHAQQDAYSLAIVGRARYSWLHLLISTGPLRVFERVANATDMCDGKMCL
jgi:hypothetical protein